MSKTVTFSTPAGQIHTEIRRLLCAGYTGRTRHLVEAHIEELKALGIGAPAHIPMLFPIMPALLSQAESTTVLGPNTAPEVEYVIFRHEGQDYVTVGSDHTDTAMESKAPAMAKNLCFKSVAADAWSIADVAAHWDDLELTLTCDGRTMQHGALNQMMVPEDLRTFVAEHDGPDHESRMIFSGTLETHGQYPRTAARIEISLTDPVLKRSITHAYSVNPMDEIFPAETQK